MPRRKTCGTAMHSTGEPGKWILKKEFNSKIV